MRFFCCTILLLTAQVAFAKNNRTVFDSYNPSLNFIFEYSLNNNKDQLYKFLSKNKSISDRKYLKEIFKELKNIPTITGNSKSLNITSDLGRVEILYSDLDKNIFYINGLKFKVDHKKNIKEQINSQLKNNRSTAALDFIPKAYANPAAGLFSKYLFGLGGFIIATFAPGVKDQLVYWSCYWGLDKFKIDYIKNGNFCSDYIKKKMEELKTSPEVNAAKGIFLNPQIPMESDMETCPHSALGDEKNKTYRSNIYLIREKLRLRLQAEIDGNKIKKVQVLAFDSPKVLATYKINDENQLEQITLPNPRKVDPSKPDEEIAIKDIEISPVSDLEDPFLKSQQNLHKSIFVQFASRMHVCNSLKQAELAEEIKKEVLIQPARAVQAVEDKK